MSGILKIASQEEYNKYVDFLRSGERPIFPNRTERMAFLRRSRWMVIINSIIFIKSNFFVLENLGDFDQTKKMNTLNKCILVFIEVLIQFLWN